jgi:hypothetical protein
MRAKLCPSIVLALPKYCTAEASQHLGCARAEALLTTQLAPNLGLTRSIAVVGSYTTRYGSLRAAL